MKKIAIITATRAEYGLLAPVIKELRKYESYGFIAELIVTGTHLSKAYGYTVNEIESDGIRIDYKLSVPVKNESSIDISNNEAEILEKFTKLFAAEQYDAVLILGDRYEMLAVSIAAMNTRIPIFHISGGDISEGAIDDCIRHCITKMSYLHFPTNEESRKRIIQMGEEPERVFNYGSTSIDNIISKAEMSKKEALDSVGLSDCRYALCTYHPVTLENDHIDRSMSELLGAISLFPEIIFIFTKSNADQGGSMINQILDEAEGQIKNVRVYTSLGVRRYLSLMRYAEFVLGNSSSGIIEAPAFHVATINIGDRQKGRLRPESIIDCGEDKESIVEAVQMATSEAFREKCKKTVNYYGDGHAAERIAKRVVDAMSTIDLKKKFYRVNVNWDNDLPARHLNMEHGSKTELKV